MAQGAENRFSRSRERIAAAAKRLLFVALFVLGFGEAPFGGGSDGASARETLRAERALALSPCGTHPGDPVVVSGVAHELPAKGLNGGEDDRFVPPQPAPRVAARREGGPWQQGPAVRGATQSGFEPRAPPATS